MAHDVFISYSTKDKPVADAVCAKLEANGLRCWIAPRDILPGMDWGGSIIEAIESASVMVLVLSASADASPQILREVERAVNKSLRIVPLRIEDIKPGKNLEYFLGTPHWLDAITPPLEAHLQYLVQTIKLLIEHEHPGSETPPPAPAPPILMTPPQAPPHPTLSVSGPMMVLRAPWRMIIGGIVGALILLFAIVWWSHRGSAVPSKFAGRWATTGFAGPDRVQFLLQIAANGTYRYEVAYHEAGQVRVQDGAAYLITADGTERQVGAVTPGSTPPTPVNLVAAVPAGAWSLIGRFSGVTPQLPETNPFRLVQSAQATGSGKERPSIWEWVPAFGQVVWHMRFEFDAGGGYIFSAGATDLGGFTASDGKWTASSDVLNTRSQGSYSFVGENSLVMTGTIRGALTTTRNGQTLWERSTAKAEASQTTPVPSPLATISPVAPAPTASPTPAVAAASPTPSPPPTVRPIDRRFIVTHDSPVYAGPDATTAIVAEVHKRKRVHITGITGDWLRVETSNGTVGFIPDAALE
jgi:hypothetical protein